MFLNSKKSGWIILTVLIFVCYFPIFFHLDGLGIQMWDEARPAVSALEMAAKNFSLKNLIVTTFDGKPDFYYTKPPMLIWVQAVFMKLFGYNELAVRLPVAIACLFTALLLYHFCATTFHDKAAGFLSAITLVSTKGYVTAHVARTGDADGFMILWTTLFVLYAFKFLHEEKEETFNRRYWLLSVLGLTCAALTKGIAGVLFVPGVFLYMMFQKKAKLVFSRKYFYYILLIFVVLVGGFYFLREVYQPGYLNAVWTNELGGRFGEAIEGHHHPFGFYFSNLLFLDKLLWIEPRFVPMLFYLPLVVFINLFLKDFPLMAKVTLFGLLVTLTYLLIISSAQTKLIWYDAPIYPVLAIIIGLGISKMTAMLSDFLSVTKSYRIGVLMIVSVAFLLSPYLSVIDKVYLPKETWDQLKYGKYLNKMARDKPELKKYIVTDHGYNGSLLFYVKALYQQKNISIQHDSTADLEFEEGKIVVTCMQNRTPEIEAKYDCEILYSEEGCKTYRIIKKKSLL